MDDELKEQIEEQVEEHVEEQAAAEDDILVVQNGASGKGKAIIAVAVVAVIAAVIGFALYFTNVVPSGSAAKYDNTYVTEQSVSDWIDQYRKVYGVTDDSDFASSLKQNSMTVASFRQNAIDQIITADLIQARADELGITVSDDEIQAKVDSVSGQVSSGDSSLWQQTLDSMGVTEDELRVRYKNDILQAKVCAQDVATRDATDDEVLSYIKSYLADSTQQHVYSIVFSGDDKGTKSKKCYKELKALKSAGKLNAKNFAKLAKKYSDAEGVAETGGELGWTGSGNVGDEVAEMIADLKVNSFSTAQTVEADDNALEIAYVDKTYTFPSASSISDLSDLKVPDDLMTYVKSAAASMVYQTNCSTYVAKLLADTDITYYPVPKDASYNVDLSSSSN